MDTSKPEDAPSAPQIALRYLIFAMILAWGIFLIFEIIHCWPGNKTGKILFGLLGDDPSNEQRMFYLVALGGALGSFIHIAKSYGDYWGSQRLRNYWLPMYVLRPFLGAALAVTFYLLLRGGLLAPTANTSDGQTATTEQVATPPVTLEDTTSGSIKPAPPTATQPSVTTNTPAGSQDEKLPINPFGMVAMACIVGLFANKASEKLGELFDAMFPTKEKLKDTLHDKPEADSPPAGGK